MTHEEKRAAIAEALGWKVHPKDRWIVIPPNSPYSVQPLNTLPDYINDLNAMHEAEKCLPDWNAVVRYHKLLKGMRSAECCPDVDRSWSATAAQRAEAFLKTIGKWKERDQVRDGAKFGEDPLKSI